MCSFKGYWIAASFSCFISELGCDNSAQMHYYLLMRLLLVEDEIDIQSFLRTSLEEAGYEVEAAADGKTAERLAVDGEFDILIVDLGLPDQDGITLILKLRQLGVRAPVLILSARRSVDDRVRGLEQGGDDYLTKPFALAELLARLRNLLKRNSPAGSEATRLRVLDLELDLLRREATRAGQILQLTPQEFVLLEYLCRNAGRVVTRSMILDKVWGMRIQPDTNVVDVHIYRLRGKVDGPGQQPLIRTLRGVGYVLKDR
jgi:two-component system copper resistance phosphate regulon response regulator CusR